MGHGPSGPTGPSGLPGPDGPKANAPVSAGAKGAPGNKGEDGNVACSANPTMTGCNRVYCQLTQVIPLTVIPQSDPMDYNFMA